MNFFLREQNGRRKAQTASFGIYGLV